MNIQPAVEPSRTPAAWRPTLLFVVAFALNGTPHEAAHALTSYLLGFNSTLFHMWVNPDAANASPEQLATIAAAGPVFSLALGAVSWLLYQGQFKRRPSGLLYLMLSLTGIYSFLGPLTGAGFGGDLNTSLSYLGAPRALLYVLSAAGAVLLALFMFFMGRELLSWVPRDLGRAKAIVFAAAAPWLLGTALTLLLYWPLPGFLVRSTLSGSIFWAFAVAGAASGYSTARPSPTAVALTRSDFVVAIAALAMVRLCANGVRLAHP